MDDLAKAHDTNANLCTQETRDGATRSAFLGRGLLRLKEICDSILFPFLTGILTSLLRDCHDRSECFLFAHETPSRQMVSGCRIEKERLVMRNYGYFFFLKERLTF
jgi:hypothetical protein